MPNPPPPCDTHHPAYDPPHNNPFYISHDTPSPSTAAVRGFGVLGLIIHFLTASSTPSPDTSWEHSRHNSLKQYRETLCNVVFMIWQHDAVVMSLCLGLGLDGHILTYIICCPRLLGSLWDRSALQVQSRHIFINTIQYIYTYGENSWRMSLFLKKYVEGSCGQTKRY